MPYAVPTAPSPDAAAFQAHVEGILGRLADGAGPDREIDYLVYGVLRAEVYLGSDFGFDDIIRSFRPEGHRYESDREARHYYSGGMHSDSMSIPLYTASLDAVLRFYRGGVGIVVPDRIPANPRAALDEALRARLPGLLAWVEDGRP